MTDGELAPSVTSGTATFEAPFSGDELGQYFTRVSVQHRTEGVGYDYSFTDFRGWVPLYESADARSLTFFDGAFLLANDQNVGMNAVVGQRFYFDEIDRTFGAFVGYDNRDTGNQTVSQIVTGIESLGDIDFRLNGYFPTDTDPVSVGNQPISFDNPTYVGYNIQLTQLSQYEVAMKGFDAEVGGAVPKLGDYLRAYIGMYNFQGEDSPQAWGWKTRLESHVTDRMRFYLTISDDQVFDTNVVFGAAFFFPGSSARRVPDYDSFVNKMDEPLIRNEAVVVNNITSSSFVNATNTTTLAAQRVIHVDPNAAAAGDGTVENPYNTLAAAQAASQANDILFVHPRADNTATNLTQDLVLKDNQRLLASTTTHSFTATQGTFELPGREIGNRPVLDSSGVAVTLANNNEVSGFFFDNTGDDSIVGSGINGFNINENYFYHFGAFGEAAVRIVGASGTGVIRDNLMQSTVSAADEGIYIELAGNSNLTIANNAINRSLSGGGSDAIYVSHTGGGDATVNIRDNSLTNFLGGGGDGIELSSSGNLVANIVGNEIYQGLTLGVADYGIVVSLNAGTAQLTIDQNTIGTIASAQALDRGIAVNSYTSDITSTYITNNTISDFLTASVFDVGISYDAYGGSTNDLVMTGNSVNHSIGNVAATGYAVTVFSGSNLNLNFQNNESSSNFASSSMEVGSEGMINMRMRDNTLTDGVILLSQSAGGRLDFEVFNGQMVPAALVDSDVFGQNTIGGTVTILNIIGGTSTRVAPNSLPIPE